MKRSKLLSWAGRLLTLLTLGYLTWVWSTTDSSDFLLSANWSRLAPCVMLCLVGNLSLSMAWRHLATAGELNSVARRQAISCYGRAQLSKYLPGNVFQYAGRQLLGARLGLSQRTLARASLLEIVGVIAAMGLLAVSGVVARLVGQGWALGLLVTAALILLAGREGLQLQKASQPQRWADNGVREALSIYLFYGACLILGLSILAVDLEIRPLVTQSFVLLEYLPLAFLAGYVVPGAPGGLGVRESLLVVLLGNEMGDSQALALALQFRLATVAADLLLFGIACAMKWQGESATPEPPRQTES